MRLRHTPHRLITAFLAAGLLSACGEQATSLEQGSTWIPHDSVRHLTRDGEVEVGRRSTAGVVFRDDRTGLSVNVRLRGVREAPRRRIDGATLQFDAITAHGGDWKLQLTSAGFEDYVSLPEPTQRDVVYELRLGDDVAGLRLIADSLELLDASGAPRLRMRPPIVIGARGNRHPAAVSLTNCAVDRDTRAPWDRPLVDPGRRQCSMHISWRAKEVRYPAVLDPSWTTTVNDLNHARRSHTASLLPDGTVIVAGGSIGFEMGSTNPPGTLCELYNPSLKSWANGNSLHSMRKGHTATVLADGSVVLVGGKNNSGTTATGVTAIESYDPQNPQALWEELGIALSNAPINLTRYAHSATLFEGDRLVVMGGRAPGGKVRADALVLNFDMNQAPSITTAGDCLATPRAHHTVSRVGADRLLVVGGFSLDDFAPFPRIYDVDVLDQSAALIAGIGNKGTILAPRAFHTAAALDQLNVLVVGGLGAATSVARYHANAGPGDSNDDWTHLELLEGPRSKHTMSELSPGLFLIAGGQSGAEVRDDATLFDVSSNRWLDAGSFKGARREHTATRLNSGEVLLVGGDDDLSIHGSGLNTSEVFSRHALGESCLNDGECLSLRCANGRCCDQTCDDPCARCDLETTEGSCTTLPPTSESASCLPYLCDGAERACPDACISDTDCVESTVCIAKKCIEPPAPKQDGANCAKATTCGSGFCTDGYCCVAETCSPYRCLGDNGTCVTSCKTSFECAEDAVCNSEGRCIGPAETLTPPSPSCRITRSRAGRPPPWWFALAAIGLRLRRRRRRRNGQKV